MRLNPYLNFAGNAEEALNFYKNALSGNVIAIMRYGESPMPCDEDYKQKIMHARLEFKGNLIMLSDVFKGQPVCTEGNISLSIEMDVEKGDELFNKLAEGGTVTMPMADQFWGARFGMLKDKFGTHWMINCTLKKEDKTLDITV